MNLKKEQGFSLIELLIVVVIVGIIASIAIPSLRRSVQAAENSSALSTMRTVSQAQAGYFSQQRRYARMNELNSSQNNALGSLDGDDLLRGKFRFALTSDSSDLALSNAFTIIATRQGSPTDLPYVMSIDQSGVLVQITP